MARNTLGARVRFTDRFLEEHGCVPLTAWGYSYAWGRIISVRRHGRTVDVHWERDGAITEVSDVRNLTVRKTGKYTLPKR